MTQVGVNITGDKVVDSISGGALDLPAGPGDDVTGKAEGVESANEPPPGASTSPAGADDVAGAEGGEGQQGTQLTSMPGVPGEPSVEAEVIDPDGEADGDAEGDGDPAPTAEVFSSESLQAMSAEYFEKGELTDATYESFAAAGVAREVVDQVVEGQRALRDLRKAEALFALDVTRSQYQELSEWAGKNWSEDQIQSFNAMVDGADPGARRMALENLLAQATGGRGTRAGRRPKGTTAAKGVTPFVNSDEMVKAMSHDDYKNRKDPYYSEVIARVNAMG